MEKKDINYCSQCPNHCPETDLKCGRGRNYFAQMRGETQEESREHRHGTGGDMHQRSDHHHWKGREFSDSADDLYGMMRACGHYLYHRSAKGAGQGRILVILSKHENMTQKELQERLQIQPGSMSEILSKLEDKGLIQRKKDEEDKRKSILELTAAGREAVESRKPQDGEQQMFDALEQSEQEELKRLLGKLLESWRSTKTV